MTTLIIPCGGKSTRFPGLKPKWMLTHPDGELMLYKSIKGCPLDLYERIIITIVSEHDKKYDAENIIRQAIVNDKLFISKNVEICVLDDFTKSASDTVYQTIKRMNVQGAITIKDSDNYVEFAPYSVTKNSIVSLNVSRNNNITDIANKSFLKLNENGLVIDIVEKCIVSNYICVGAYLFESANDFVLAFEHLNEIGFAGEMYISHVISYMLSQKDHVFTSIEAKSYKDWGTLKEWRKEQVNYRTFFIDFDGVLIKNCGKYGELNWKNNSQMLEDNCSIIKRLQNSGAQIVITTARPWNLRGQLENLLKAVGIYPYAIVMGLNHSQRVIINDFAPSNAYPSCQAISLPRNGRLSDYLN